MLVCAVFSGGCRKKDVLPGCNEPSGIEVGHMELVEPLPFLPAYPGSWWQYSDGSTITTGDEYALAPILGSQWDPNHGLKYCCIEEVAYLPVYDGRPLYHYSRMKVNASQSLGEICCEKILSEQLGETFMWGGSHYGRSTSKVMSVDTTVVLTNGNSYSTCIVVARDLGFPGTNPSMSRYYEVYARNVGLIKTWLWIGQDTIIKELDSYHIATN